MTLCLAWLQSQSQRYDDACACACIADVLTPACICPEAHGLILSSLSARSICVFADTAALQLGRKDLVVGTAAVSVGEDCGDLDAVQFLASAAVIANMAVDQKYRKQGIAGLLLQACEQHALAMGTEYISLVVHKQNNPARGLYESSGFREMPPAKPTGLSGFLRFGSGTEHIVMAKRLSEDFSV